MTTPWPHRWEQLVRYRFIEVIALWEGRLTTRHLCDTFGIGRQQASKDINVYIREIAPDNLHYDKYIKGYVPTKGFLPQVTRGHADEYLQLLARNSELQQTFSDLALATPNTEILTVPKRSISAEILRPLIQAARQRLRIEVDYVSVNNPDREGRIIVPHTLVWTGLRWHVRGWCEKNQDYRDFVLSRFRDTPEILGASDKGVEEDVDWNTLITLRIEPDPRLSFAQRQVVAEDHGMIDNALLINTRARLVPYLLKLLNLDPHEHHQDPRAQQIVLSNLAALKPWLLG
ncbi:WYL domain-containing protein [Flavobacteriaceae bacterium]|nr:WYL domain-containing protein [Flavobacteriaceae bacterium]